VRESEQVAEMENVLGRLKQRATYHGETGIPLNMREAREIVTLICDDECTRQPPPEAVEYLAAELVRLVSEANHLRQRS
jgi:hypothetical protein